MADRITTMFTEEEVDSRIAELGRQISEEYEGRTITMVCILKGAVTFACELAKRITVPVEMEFMRCSSYGNETESSGVSILNKPPFELYPMKDAWPAKE